MLERVGLISRGRDAQRRPSRLEVKPLEDAIEWLAIYRKFWKSVRRLDALLDELKAACREASTPIERRTLE